MQHRYVADIGDFGKFQLFRFLFDDRIHTLAQIWYLHEKEERNNDGRHIDYFSRVKGSDPELEAIMIAILKEDKRHLLELENRGVLPIASYFYEPLPLSLSLRHDWFSRALAFSSSHPIVALAPDNGLALLCDRKNQSFSFLGYHDKKSTPHKYAYIHEIEAFFKTPNRKITIIYQHLGRCFSHQKQIEVLLDALHKRFGYVIAIKHKPYAPRVFFFLCHDREIYASLHTKLQLFCHKYPLFWSLHTLNL